MGFVLNINALRSLTEIRTEYEQEKQIKLNSKTSKIGVPTFFGGTNVEKRAKQIIFIEKMLLVLADNLTPSKLDDTEEIKLARLTASRMLIAVCLYVQAQISQNYKVLTGKNAFLYQLINKKLGVSALNPIDQEDRATCFDIAHILLAIPNSFEQANIKLKKLNVAPIDINEWDDFKYAVNNEYQPARLVKYQNDYPITSITKPLFGVIFAYAGASLGFLGGEVASKSSQMMPTSYVVSTGLSCVALTFQGSNTLGASLLASVVGNYLLKTFFQVSLGHIGAVTFNIVGKGVGTAVGLPLDMTYHLVSATCAAIIQMCKKIPNQEGISGTRISDGMLIVDGLELTITPSSDMNEEETREIAMIEILADGKIFINGKFANTENSEPAECQHLILA